MKAERDIEDLGDRANMWSAPGLPGA